MCDRQCDRHRYFILQKNVRTLHYLKSEHFSHLTKEIKPGEIERNFTMSRECSDFLRAGMRNRKHRHSPSQQRRTDLDRDTRQLGVNSDSIPLMTEKMFSMLEEYFLLYIFFSPSLSLTHHPPPPSRLLIIC